MQTERIKYRISIHEHPKEVETQEEFGHWESDNVLDVRGTRTLHTTVERTSRYFAAVMISTIATAATLGTQLDYYQRLPVHAVRSVTVDNGSKLAHHYR